jgi:hypothetical protein
MSRPDPENIVDASATTAGSRSGANSSKRSLSYEEKKKQWWEWHKANPQVWEYFERFALEAVNRRVKKISHWLIINRIRWEIYFETEGGEFKISNDYIAFYARLWKAKYPQHKSLFNTKRMIGEPYDTE